MVNVLAPEHNLRECECGHALGVPVAPGEQTAVCANCGAMWRFRFERDRITLGGYLR